MFAKNDNRRLRLAIFLDENTSDRSAGAKQVKIVFSDVLALDERWFTSRRNAEVLRAGDRGHPFETVRLISIIQVIGIRDRRTKPDQAARLLHHRQRANENCVDNTEDRRV